MGYAAETIGITLSKKWRLNMAAVKDETEAFASIGITQDSLLKQATGTKVPSPCPAIPPQRGFEPARNILASNVPRTAWRHGNFNPTSLTGSKPLSQRLSSSGSSVNKRPPRSSSLGADSLP